jgi:hypothetical protein
MVNGWPPAELTGPLALMAGMVLSFSTSHTVPLRSFMNVPIDGFEVAVSHNNFFNPGKSIYLKRESAPKHIIGC